MDRALRLLGLAKKAGRVEVGEEPVGAVCRAHKARLVILAQDAAENTVRRAKHFSELGGAVCVSVPCSKDELGAALGRASCAMAALTDAGFAAGFLEKLAAEDPARYGEAHAALSAKAQKLLQRQREQRQHEKNLARGKKKPWAAPPKTGENK